MPETNVDVTRHAFECYSRAHYADAADCLAADVVYDKRLFDVYTLRDGKGVRKLESSRRSEALRATGMGDRSCP